MFDMEWHGVKEYYRGYEILGYLDHNRDSDSWTWRATVTNNSSFGLYSKDLNGDRTFSTEAEAHEDLLRKARMIG